MTKGNILARIFFVSMLFFLLFFSTILIVTFSTGLRHSSFFAKTYRVEEDHKKEFYVKQVPGDGSCLFHALAVCLHHKTTARHCKSFDQRLKHLSRWLRKVAVDYLSRNNLELFVEEDVGNITSNDLLSMVAEKYNVTTKEYCDKMRNSTEWGGILIF